MALRLFTAAGMSTISFTRDKLLRRYCLIIVKLWNLRRWLSLRRWACTNKSLCHYIIYSEFMTKVRLLALSLYGRCQRFRAWKSPELIAPATIAADRQKIFIGHAHKGWIEKLVLACGFSCSFIDKHSMQSIMQRSNLFPHLLSWLIFCFSNSKYPQNKKNV